MNRVDAKTISIDRDFTKKEMEDVLKKAFEDKSIDWKKPSPSNAMMSMGKYFNLCLDWVRNGSRGKTKEHTSSMAAYRVLHGFGKYHPDYPFGIIKRKKSKTTVQVHEEPSMD